MKQTHELELMVSKAKMDIRSFMHANQYQMAFELFTKTAAKLDGRMLKEFVNFFG
jgi:hypothetical protein